MLIHADDLQSKAILGAMHQVATAKGRQPFSELCAAGLKAAGHHVFHLDDVRLDDLPSCSHGELAAILADRDQREQACRFLAIMPLVDGQLDHQKIDVFLQYADALQIHDDYVTELNESRHNLDWALNDMTRQNINSIWHEPWDGRDPLEVILPYRRGIDLSLASRYRALGNLAPGTFGRAFWEVYRNNAYAFPGEEHGVNARFGTPHDSTHVVSGYDASPQGEILVSTFTAGMHPKQPMGGHTLPVIFSFHLGIQINRFAGAAKGHLDLEKFWVAWGRGNEMNTDLFAEKWDFWSVIEEPVETVRTRYQVPELDPRFAATP